MVSEALQFSLTALFVLAAVTSVAAIVGTVLVGVLMFVAYGPVFGGFANLASIGIQISGIGTMVPSRRGDLAALAWPAFVAATLGSCMTACVVGIVAG